MKQAVACSLRTAAKAKRASIAAERCASGRNQALIRHYGYFSRRGIKSAIVPLSRRATESWRADRLDPRSVRLRISTAPG